MLVSSIRCHLYNSGFCKELRCVIFNLDRMVWLLLIFGLENICDIVIGVIGKGMHDGQKVLVKVVAGKLI